MKRMATMLALAILWLAVAAWGQGGEVRTRKYGPQAATDGRVVTRPMVEEVPPSAGTVPFALSIVPGVSLPFDNWSVVGIRINLLAGRHRDLWGLDAGGLGNDLTGSLTGLQAAGLWNRVGNAPAALQSAGLANLCERDFCGVQIAGIYNWTGEEFMGLQTGLLNRAGGLTGVQVGLYNAADHGTGVQIGVVNAARSLAGMQIGVVNYNAESALEFLPIINLAF